MESNNMDLKEGTDVKEKIVAINGVQVRIWVSSSYDGTKLVSVVARQITEDKSAYKDIGNVYV